MNRFCLVHAILLLQIVFGDVTDPASIQKVFAANEPFDTVVSCLASRSGGIEDSNLIDYQATSNCLQVNFCPRVLRQIVKPVPFF